MFETENIEFKLKVTDDLYKEVIAFANTDGGTIYIGIDDEGNVVGIENVDENVARITNGIRDAIMPDVTMFVKYKVQDNRILQIIVGEGSNKPYYLKVKGLKPSGVFVRQGASSVPASFDQIRSMIKESDGDAFESMRSIEQDLTFESAKKAFSYYNIEFTEEKYRALGVTFGAEPLYTNLALILSDQCAHTTKVAVFKDAANTEFSDSKEFGGSVFDQLDSAFAYLRLCNKTVASYEGLKRIESVDYPEVALREALLNALVHRDYSFSGSVIVNVNEKEMEFISIGGLLPGLSPEDIRSGISQPRNKRLADVFYRLRLIESYGTGIRRIYKLYEGYPMQPRIEVTQNTFKIVLPNMNRAQKARASTVTAQMQSVLNYIEEHGKITDLEIQNLLNIKKTRAFTLAKDMRAQGLIQVIGRGETKAYVKYNG
jgi:ATP-dependent DNA helicase RecG